MAQVAICSRAATSELSSREQMWAPMGESMLWVEWIRHKRALDTSDKEERGIERRRAKAQQEAHKKGKSFTYEDDHGFVQELFEVQDERQYVLTRWLTQLGREPINGCAATMSAALGSGADAI